MSQHQKIKKENNQIKQQSSQILFHKNKIIIIHANPSSHFIVLMSHPQYHKCIQKSNDTYQFQPKTNQKLHFSQIVTVLQLSQQNKIIKKFQNVVTVLQKNQYKSTQSLGNNQFHNQNQLLQNIQNLQNNPTSNIKNNSKINPETQKIFYITKYQLNLSNNNFQSQQFNQEQNSYKYDVQQLGPDDMTGIMQKMKKYGDFKRMYPQGGSLALTFPVDLHKKQLETCFLFQNQENSQFFKQKKLTYYVITETLPLFRKKTKIMQIPQICKSKQILIYNGWIIIRSKKMVIFIRNKEPFQDIYNIQFQGASSLFTYFPDKIGISKYKYYHFYDLSEKAQSIQKISQIKIKGLQPLCFSSYGKHCLIAGRNHQAPLIGQDKVSQSRHVYLFLNFHEYNLKSNKAIVPDRKILVSENCKTDLPIEMIHGLPDLNLFVCYFNRNIYVVHINGETGVLSQIKLESQYKLVKFLPYNFNIVNFIGVTWLKQKTRQSDQINIHNQHNYGNILRVGIDSYMGQYGIQLKSYNSFCYAKNVSISMIQNKPIVYILSQDGSYIAQCNLLSQKIIQKVVEYPKNKNIQLMTSYQNTIVYITYNNSHYDIYHMKLLY